MGNTVHINAEKAGFADGVLGHAYDDPFKGMGWAFFGQSSKYLSGYLKGSMVRWNYTVKQQIEGKL